MWESLFSRRQHHIFRDFQGALSEPSCCQRTALELLRVVHPAVLQASLWCKVSADDDDILSELDALMAENVAYGWLTAQLAARRATIAQFS